MIRSATTTTKTLASLLLVALAVFCLGDLVQAAVMPPGERADCVVCAEQTPCSSPTATPLVLPVAVPATPDAGLAPTAAAMISARSEPPLAPDRQVVPRAPRSPPLA
jgi:hypothetical protein